jgi:hypothetical protein
LRTAETYRREVPYVHGLHTSLERTLYVIATGRFYQDPGMLTGWHNSRYEEGPEYRANLLVRGDVKKAQRWCYRWLRGSRDAGDLVAADRLLVLFDCDDACDPPVIRVTLTVITTPSSPRTPVTRPEATPAFTSTS